jgi:transposase
MHQQRYKQQAIANAMGLTQGTVSYTIKRAKTGDVAALRHHKPPGAPERLSAEQKQQLLTKLAQGAEAHRFHGDV